MGFCGDVDDDLDLLCAELVEEARRHRVGQVEAERLDEVENTSVAQPVVALAGIGKLVEHNDLIVRVFYKVFDGVVTNEAAAARDQALGSLARRRRPSAIASIGHDDGGSLLSRRRRLLSCIGSVGRQLGCALRHDLGGIIALLARHE